MCPTQDHLIFSHCCYDFCPLPDPDVGPSVLVSDVEHTSFHFFHCSSKFVLRLFGECPGVPVKDNDAAFKIVIHQTNALTYLLERVHSCGNNQRLVRLRLHHSAVNTYHRLLQQMSTFLSIDG